MPLLSLTHMPSLRVSSQSPARSSCRAVEFLQCVHLEPQRRAAHLGAGPAALHGPVREDLGTCTRRGQRQRQRSGRHSEQTVGGTLPSAVCRLPCPAIYPLLQASHCKRCSLTASLDNDTDPLSLSLSLSLLLLLLLPLSLSLSFSLFSLRRLYS